MRSTIAIRLRAARSGARAIVPEEREIHPQRQSEIEELHPTVAGEKDVERFEVPVNHAPLVRCREASGQAPSDLRSTCPGKRKGKRGEALSFEQLGDQIGQSP